MRSRRGTHTLVGLAAVGVVLVGLAPAGFAALAVSSPALAAEQSVLENPPVAGAGVCPELGGVIGQSFTLQEPGALSSYGFWVAAADTPAGETLTATVSVGWWIEGGLRPFVEQDVSFTVPAEPALTTLTPVTPIPLLPNTMFAIVVDLHGVNACPVTFSPGADYGGGFAVLGSQQAEGDLAFQFGLSPVDQEPGPGPYVPPGFIGSAPPGTVGVPYAYQFRLVGSNDPTIQGQDLMVPGLQLDADGLLSGTPTQAGTFVSEVHVTDGTLTNARDIVITIAAAPPPGAAPPVAAPPVAAPAPPAPVPASPATRTIPATGVEPVPATAVAAAALLAGAVLAAGAALGRRGHAGRRDLG
ncbi:hypothetical protein [Agromyces silvae]|uniref:hypothetical protein n=1 Tax=Agromyces silvae TaxID=3388266 RepID=UPI00280B5A1C|nr:hypothetical protein [Agromyces protaetiae]